MNRESVEQLRARLQVDLANTVNSVRQIEGALAACDRLIADDDVAIEAAKAAEPPPEVIADAEAAAA